MELIVLRFSSQSDSTSGLLFEKTDLGMKFLCYTLEDERRALKVKGETRVPAGIYNIELRKENQNIEGFVYAPLDFILKKTDNFKT